MIVDRLLAKVDSDVVVEMLRRDNLVEETKSLIEEQSYMQEFIQAAATGKNPKAVIMGSVLTLGLLHRMAEQDKATKGWLQQVVFSKPTRFFTMSYRTLKRSPTAFLDPAEEAIGKSSLPFKWFLEESAEEFGDRFTFGATVIIGLLIRSENSGKADLN